MTTRPDAEGFHATGRVSAYEPDERDAAPPAGPTRRKGIVIARLIAFAGVSTVAIAQGNLTIRGETQPVSLRCQLTDDRVRPVLDTVRVQR